MMKKYMRLWSKRYQNILRATTKLVQTVSYIHMDKSISHFFDFLKKVRNSELFFQSLKYMN
jgi:hypothetical protein